jgi:hypothetical protein
VQTYKHVKINKKRNSESIGEATNCTDDSFLFLEERGATGPVGQPKTEIRPVMLRTKGAHKDKKSQ